jgi:hypothetical protein
MIRKFTEFVKSVVEHFRKVRGPASTRVVRLADRHQDKHIAYMEKPEKLQKRPCFFLQVPNWCLRLG